MDSACTPTDYLRVISAVANSGKPNYLGRKIELGTNFQLTLWEKKLRQYEDKQVVNLLRFGLTLGISVRSQLERKNINNHPMATQFSEHVDAFLQKELLFKAILGPFQHPPHPLFHCSPLLTRPKDLYKRRVIVDLSYGDGDAVNKMTEKGVYEGQAFTLQSPSLDHVLQQILQLNKPKLIKADISRAFRNVPIDPVPL